MTDYFDTGRISDAPEYWDALADRVAAHAARKGSEGGVGWLARSRAGWIAAVLLLATALSAIALPDDSEAARSLRTEWASAFAPQDEMARAMVLRDEPPAIAALLLGRDGGGGM